MVESPCRSCTHAGLDKNEPPCLGCARIAAVQAEAAGVRAEALKRARKAGGASPKAKKPIQATACSTPGCGRPVCAGGLCATHYHRWWQREKQKREDERAAMVAAEHGEKTMEKEPDRKPCQVNGCDKPAEITVDGLDMCGEHFRLIKENGKAAMERAKKVVHLTLSVDSAVTVPVGGGLVELDRDAWAAIQEAIAEKSREHGVPNDLVVLGLVVEALVHAGALDIQEA